MPRDPRFDVMCTEEWHGDHFVVGTSAPGLAGLTAADHLVKTRSMEQIGHVLASNLPDITPFEDGRPRLPLRLYADPNASISILVGELFIPAWAADPFVEALRGWIDDAGPERVTMLHGVPYPHGPDEHDVFAVAAPEPLAIELTDAGVRPMEGGYLDGVAGELMAAHLAGLAPPTAALVTPTHPPGPDFEAAVRLLGAIEDVIGVSVDERELQERAEEMRRYYQELADRMARFERGEQSLRGQDFPEDRMYM